MEYGWIDSRTPPQGFRLNCQGWAIINMWFASAFRAKIYEFITEGQSGALVQLPPPPDPWGPPVTIVVITLYQYSGQSFCRQGYIFIPSNTRYISYLTFNSLKINVPVFYFNRNRIYWLLCQMLKWFVSLEGWPTVINIKLKVSRIAAIMSIRASANTRPMEVFIHPTLSQEELQLWGRLGLYYWADTSWLGKYAYVEEFFEGRTVTDTGFTSTLGSMKYLPIANIMYAYDISYETTIILEHNNTIYMGNDIFDSLYNPIQSKESDNRVDLISKYNKGYQEGFQSAILKNGTVITILYDGVLPCITVRPPIHEEIYEC